MVLASAVVQGDPIAAAEAVALHYVNDEEPGILRQRRGKHFRYVDAAGKPVRDAETLSRIRALAILPAWRGVWISPDSVGHIQATGRDAKNRIVRDEAKYRLVAFSSETIAVDALRAVEPIVARYLDTTRRRRRA